MMQSIVAGLIASIGIDVAKEQLDVVLRQAEQESHRLVSV
jgi:capsular polysaccharide biosynthesis protein